MLSLRKYLNCISSSRGKKVSVLRDFYGFSRGRVPKDSYATASVSIKKHIELLRSPRGYFNLNVTRVGFDKLSSGEKEKREEFIDYAIYRLREIYGSVGIGVGRILNFWLDSAEVGGLDDISNKDELSVLVSEHNHNNNGIEMFIVRTISAEWGGTVTKRGGSCVKGPSADGAVLDGGLSQEKYGKSFAHEIGHFLGEQHLHQDGDNQENCPASVAEQNNLMSQARCSAGAVTNGRAATSSDMRAACILTSEQANRMCEHCSVQDPCS